MILIIPHRFKILGLSIAKFATQVVFFKAAAVQSVLQDETGSRVDIVGTETAVLRCHAAVNDIVKKHFLFNDDPCKRVVAMLHNLLVLRLFLQHETLVPCIRAVAEKHVAHPTMPSSNNVYETNPPPRSYTSRDGFVRVLDTQ